MKRGRIVGAIAVAGAAAAYWFLARPRHLWWGATDEEAGAPLPGDELIADAALVATRAIATRAPIEDVWPWIAQMGQGRGGLYSYDALENLVGCDIHSADRVVAEWQDVAVGDEFRLHPDVPLTVALVEPGRALVIRGAVEMGENAPAPPYDFTWAFVLDERFDGTTRLVVRERYGYTARWARLLVEPVELVSFVMTQKMLRGIRDRAERAGTIPGASSLSEPEDRA
jgi:hypothetical protein